MPEWLQLVLAVLLIVIPAYAWGNPSKRFWYKRPGRRSSDDKQRDWESLQSKEPRK